MKSVLAILSTIAVLASGQAQKANKDVEHDTSTVQTLTDQTWIKDIMHKGEKTHMFILYESMDCTECRKYSTMLAKLAEHTNGSPQVARANCHLTASHFCKAFQI